MLNDDVALRVTKLSKCYRIYHRPQDRLKQLLYPRLRALIGAENRRYYREFWALKDISFEVRKGTTVGIIGRNGSGKSTLLQIICNIFSPTSGAVESSGRVAALLELGAGFNPEFTGRENVHLNGAILGLTNDEIHDRFDDVAAFADIGDFMDQPVKIYSSGMFVRLAFAIAVNVDPQILVVDEALSVGDELFQRKCFSRMEAIKGRGATIIFVSHSGSTIVDLCDEVILLDGGEKLISGVPKLVVAQYQKLLYAPEDKREAIRREICSSDSPLPIVPAAARTSEQSDHEPTRQSFRRSIEEFFDPNLKPQSTLSYESHGVSISIPQILTMSGESVNNLVRGRTYRYVYQVRILENVSNVRFGMLIKTTSGFELGGSTSAPAIGQSIPFIDADTDVNVEFRFTCNLNSGTFFLNAGVVGMRLSEETYLHRVIDVCMFRVLPEGGNIVTGPVDFGCVPKISVANPRSELRAVP